MDPLEVSVLREEDPVRIEIGTSAACRVSEADVCGETMTVALVSSMPPNATYCTMVAHSNDRNLFIFYSGCLVYLIPTRYSGC